MFCRETGHGTATGNIAGFMGFYLAVNPWILRLKNDLCISMLTRWRLNLDRSHWVAWLLNSGGNAAWWGRVASNPIWQGTISQIFFQSWGFPLPCQITRGYWWYWIYRCRGHYFSGRDLFHRGRNPIWIIWFEDTQHCERLGIVALYDPAHPITNLACIISYPAKSHKPKVRESRKDMFWIIFWFFLTPHYLFDSGSEIFLTYVWLCLEICLGSGSLLVDLGVPWCTLMSEPGA